jgi:hypothetical protein
LERSNKLMVTYRADAVKMAAGPYDLDATSMLLRKHHKISRVLGPA